MRLVFIIAIGFCLCSFGRGVAADEKQQSVKVVLSVVNSLAQIASDRSSVSFENPELPTKDKQVLERLISSLSPDELGKTAVICWTLYNPGNADSVNYDEVYYEAFWTCVRRLSHIEGRDAYTSLVWVQAHARLDGGEKLSFDNIIQEFKKRNPKLDK